MALYFVGLQVMNFNLNLQASLFRVGAAIRAIVSANLGNLAATVGTVISIGFGSSMSMIARL
jgi:hypothetical protein